MGETGTLTATVAPEDAGDKTVTWSSSNTAVATVSNGVVTAKKAGTATITVKTMDGGKTATCSVTVNPVAVTGISLDSEELTLEVGETGTLTATVAPDDAGDKTVTWSSSDETVAVVTDGVVTALKAGTANITVTTEDGGLTDSCAITVKPIAVTGITLNKTTLTLNVGAEEILTATVTPEDAANKELSWTSSDTSVVLVSEGIVFGKSAGTATVTAEAEDGSGVKATCTVTVQKVAVTSITITGDEVIYVDDTITLSASVMPSNATNKEVEWTSSNPAVATVDDGMVTALAEGEVTITATSKDDSTIFAEHSITILAPVTAPTLLGLNQSSFTISVGNMDYVWISAINPEDADDSVSWSIANTSVATLSGPDSDKVVTITGVAVGTTTITVTSTVDPTVSASCTVTVVEAPTAPVLTVGTQESMSAEVMRIHFSLSGLNSDEMYYVNIAESTEGLIEFNDSNIDSSTGEGHIDVQGESGGSYATKLHITGSDGLDKVYDNVIYVSFSVAPIG